MRKIKWHILILTVYSIWGMLLDLYAYGSDIRIPLSFAVLCRQYWIVYTGYAVLYFLFLGNKKYTFYFLPTIIVSFFGTYFFTSLYELIHNLLYEKVNYTTKQIITSVIETYSHFFIVSLGLFFFVRYQLKQKETKLLLEKNLTLEKNLIQSENDFLRAQINPHFLYNSLNYFYAETFEVLPNVGDSIMILSEIMRYSLTDFSATDGKAKLSEEVKNIENILKINRLRFGNSLHINFNVEGDANGKQILPMLFITLVENIFKHGDLQDAAYPATITCTIDEEAKKVTFITLNKKSNKPNDTPGGLGAKNIQKRLELLYDKNFTLQFADEEIALYKATLVIPYFETLTNKL